MVSLKAGSLLARPGRPFAPRQKGQALLTGDSFHHPIQVAYPEWHSAFCMDLQQSTASRRKILDKLTDKDIWMLAAHFNTPTAAHVVSNGDRRKLKI